MIPDGENVQNQGWPRPRVGVSACLLGQEVRYNGQHKRDAFLVQAVARFVEFVPVCPEVEIGLGTPREPIHLEVNAGGLRLLGVTSGEDHTDAMRHYAQHKVDELARQHLSGYVLKKDSPSCGMERVKVYHGDRPVREGRGLFAEALMERSPLTPVEEEGRLNDPRLRENFFERVFARFRLQTLFDGSWSVGELVEFHTREKLLLMAHDPSRYQSLGQLVAQASRNSADDFAARYQHGFMAALRGPTTIGRHCNALEHIMGFFKRELSAAHREDLRRAIDDYRNQLVPMIVPIRMLRHFIDVYDVTWLRQQTYLAPFPDELKLRNYV